MDRLLLRVGEVAEALGIGRSKAYELVAGGTIPSIRLGGCVRVPADALRDWVAAQADQAATAEPAPALHTVHPSGRER